MLAKIRRMHLRDGMSIREVCRRTGLSRNTVRHWLRQEGVTEPKYPKRASGSAVDAFGEHLEAGLRADAQRPVRERRRARALFEQIRAIGFRGSYPRVVVWVRQWRERQAAAPRRAAFVPMSFELGEAFQFDWSCEYLFVGGLRRRLEAAHLKLAASRAFWLVAYPAQSHEMLFDAHTRSFAALGGVPRRGIYDNMKTAVDSVGVGKARAVNARFAAMCSHYLFEPEFCNPASGWEKGVVEKNVLDRRRSIWREAAERRWPDLAALNAWLAERCRQSWAEAAHPEWPALTVAEVLQDEQARLMPCPKPFDGYVEQPVRVSATSLVHFQRNRYSVPCRHVNDVLSLRVYPSELVLVADGEEVARHARSFERHQTIYDWRHYIELVERKPGALRNGAPVKHRRFGAWASQQGPLPAKPIEDFVVDQIVAALSAPHIVQSVWERIRQVRPEISEPEVVLPMRNLAGIWRELFPVEQCRLAKLLIVRVIVADGGLEIIWRDQGWRELAVELMPGTIGRRQLA